MRWPLLLGLAVAVCEAAAEEGERKVVLEGQMPQLTPLQGYQRLLKTKRNEQLGATKAVMAIPDYSKRYKMVTALTSAMHKVVKESRIELESKAGFTPGDPFPEQDSQASKDLADALSRVHENAAFFADLALRLPDIAPQIFRKDSEFQNLMKWALVFANSTGFFDATTTQLMHLAGMELDIVPRDPDFVNPYREAKRKEAEELARNVSEEMAAKKAQKKAQAKRARGPRLGGRAEL